MITRRAALATVAAGLPRFAIGQPECPAITVAVQKIANTGTLDPSREQSSNAIERNPRAPVVGGPVPNHRIVNFDHHHPALRDPPYALRWPMRSTGGLS